MKTNGMMRRATRSTTSRRRTAGSSIGWRTISLIRRSALGHGLRTTTDPGPLGSWRFAMAQLAVDPPLRHGVDQRPNRLDRDVDLVARRQRELVGRDDARAGQQDAAPGKAVVSIEIVDELPWLPLQRCKGR